MNSQDEQTFRCAECHTYKLNARLTWVPDSILMGDSLEAIDDQVRRTQYNGQLSGWCDDCVRRLMSRAQTKPSPESSESWWSMMRRGLFGE